MTVSERVKAMVMGTIIIPAHLSMGKAIATTPSITVTAPTLIVSIMGPVVARICNTSPIDYMGIKSGRTNRSAAFFLNDFTT